MLILLYSVAGLLALAAVAGVGWALLSDRSRGRRRCPKCFHSMDPAIGLVCPECGHDIKDERRLYKTRRRRGLALLLVVLLGTPAALTGGFARIKQSNGWSILPGSIATRLFWIDDPQLDDDIEARIRAGHLPREQMQIVVDESLQRIEAGRPESIESGLSFLKVIANNTNVGDTWRASRPRLSQLKPKRTTEVLVQLGRGTAARWPTIANLLASMEDTEPLALVALIEMLSSSDAAIAGNAWSALIIPHREESWPGRLPAPGPPREALDPMRSRHPRDTPLMLARRNALSLAVAGLEGDLPAIRDWAKGRWDEVTTGAVPTIDRLAELWLWCRIDGFGPESSRAVFAAADDQDSRIARYALSLLRGMEWSKEIEELLGTQMSSSDQRTRTKAIETIAYFGTQAKALIPDLLRQAASADGLAGNSGFVEDFENMGGDPLALRDAVAERLEIIHANHLDRTFRDFMGISGSGPAYNVTMDFSWLATIGEPSDEAIEICRKFMSFGEYNPSLQAAIAYAAMTGNKSEVSRLFLEKQPDLSGPFISDSKADSFLILVMYRLADPEMVMDYYLNEAEPEQRDAFVTMLFNFVGDWRVIEDYLPLLNALTPENAGSATLDEVEELIERYKDRKPKD